MGSLGGQDLDDLSVLQLVVERDHPPVDLGAYAAVPHLGVDAICEIDWRRVGGQIEHVSLRREHVDLVLEEVDLDGVEERLRIPDLVLPFEQASEPRQLLVEARVLAAFFVSPVGCHPELRDPVHLVGTDLDLYWFAGVRDDGRVQRLIAVRLGHRYVVLESPRNRLPQRMDHAQHPVAVAHRVHLHADRREVVDLRKVLLLAGHLLPDRVDVLGPAGDLSLDPDVVELASEDLAEV